MKAKNKRAQNRRRNNFNNAMINKIDSNFAWNKASKALKGFELKAPKVLAFRPLVNALISWTTPGCRCHKLSTMSKTEQLLILVRTYNSPKLDVSKCPRCNALNLMRESSGTIDPEELMEFTELSLVWLDGGLFCLCYGDGRPDCRMCIVKVNLKAKLNSVRKGWTQATSKETRKLLGITK